MFGNRFYHETTRRYVAMFGTLFNDIVIERKDNQNQLIQKMKVPIHYAPMQKVLARLEGDPSLNAPAMTLPRMSFEITNMNFSPERKLTSLTRNTYQSTDANSKISQFVPAPYDIEFQLNIMVKYQEDGTKILEQILPFFKPDVTVSVQLIDDMELKVDVPIILNNVVMDDSYEGDFLTRRSLTYTLGFTVRGYYFGPMSNKKVIKFVQTPVKDTVSSENLTSLSTQPGLTADGEPTNILTGETATATTTNLNGQIVSAEIVNTGFAYEQATATISPPDTRTATGGGIVANDTSISSVEIDNPGGYYSHIPTVQFAAGTLSSTPAVVYAFANTQTNELGNITIENAGRYYVESPNVTIQDPPVSIQATANTTHTSNTILFTMGNNGTNYESANVTVEYTVLQDTNTYSADSRHTDENVSLIGTESIPLYGNSAPIVGPEPTDIFQMDQAAFVIKVPDGSQMIANTDYPITNGLDYKFGFRKENNGDIVAYHEIDQTNISTYEAEAEGNVYDTGGREVGDTPLNQYAGQWIRVNLEHRLTTSAANYYFLYMYYEDSEGTFQFISPPRFITVRGMQFKLPMWAADTNSLEITAPPGFKIDYVNIWRKRYDDDTFDPGDELGASYRLDTDDPFADNLPGPVDDVTYYYADFENANTISKTVQTTTNITNFSINSIDSINDAGIISVESVVIDAPTPARTAFAFAGINQGKLTNIIFQDRGFGYNFNDFFVNGENKGAPVAEFTIENPTGTSSQFIAQGTANVSNGEVVGVEVTTSGLGYDASNPPVVVFGPPISRTATANVEIDAATKEVSKINIVDGGLGYRGPASIVISQPDEITIPYDDISSDDDWGYIVQISEGE